MSGPNRHGHRRPTRSAEGIRAIHDRAARRGARATREGRFDEALRWYRRCRGYARLLDDPQRRDAADLNIAMVRLQAGEPRRAEEGLREILLRTSDDRVAFSAAYSLASSLRQQSRHERAMSYAERALHRARQLGADDLVASSEMLVGNVLMARSYPERAIEHYQRALAIREREQGDNRYSRAILLENLGYCRVQMRELDAGLSALDEALVLAVEVGDDRCRAECHQDLCYGHLLHGTLDVARDHGHRALELSRERGYADIEENCHYLLGELCSRCDDLAGRDRHFLHLQQLHPELPFLKDFLCAVDVTSIITLKR